MEMLIIEVSFELNNLYFTALFFINYQKKAINRQLVCKITNKNRKNEVFCRFFCYRMLKIRRIEANIPESAKNT